MVLKPSARINLMRKLFMTNSDDFDSYVERALERFDTFVSWSVSYWPRTDSPLSAEDFSASRAELVQLLGARLSAIAGSDIPGIIPAPASSTGKTDSGAQYLPVTPAPWP